MYIHTYISMLNCASQSIYRLLECIKTCYIKWVISINIIHTLTLGRYHL